MVTRLKEVLIVADMGDGCELTVFFSANKAGPKSTFASVEEFADLLEASGTTDPGTAKQVKIYAHYCRLCSY